MHAKRKREDELGDELGDESDPIGASLRPEPGPDDLYVMQNSRIAGELKVGRSQDVEARRRALQRSQYYRMLVLAVFPQAGKIEARMKY